MASLFDTPQDIIKQQSAERQAYVDANETPGTLSGIYQSVTNRARGQGYGIGQAAAGVAQVAAPQIFGENPQVRARKISEIKDKVEGQYKFGTPEYFEAASQELASNGFKQEAMQAGQYAREIKKQSLGNEKTEMDIQTSKAALGATKMPKGTIPEPIKQANRQILNGLNQDGIEIPAGIDENSFNTRDAALTFSNKLREVKGTNIETKVDAASGQVIYTDKDNQRTWAEPIDGYKKPAKDVPAPNIQSYVGVDGKPVYYDAKNPDQAQKALSVLNNGGSINNPPTTLIERALQNSNMNPKQQEQFWAAYLANQAAGNGMQMTVSPDGTVKMTQGNIKSTNELPKDLIDQKAKTLQFIMVKNNLVEKLKGDKTVAGLTGGVQKLGGELSALAKNTATLLGVSGNDFAKYSADLRSAANSLEVPEGAGVSAAAYRSTMFQLSLIYASAAGLGEGRALTDADVERAKDAILMNSNNPNQIAGALNALGDVLMQGIDARTRVALNPNAPMSELVQGSAPVATQTTPAQSTGNSTLDDELKALDAREAELRQKLGAQ